MPAVDDRSGIGPLIASAMVAAGAYGTAFAKGATQLRNTRHSGGSVRSRVLNDF
jgi:hypothetical protein